MRAQCLAPLSCLNLSYMRRFARISGSFFLVFVAWEFQLHGAEATERLFAISVREVVIRVLEFVFGSRSIRSELLSDLGSGFSNCV